MFNAHMRALIERMEADSAAVFFSAPEQIRNRDVHYDYRQDSHLYYLTGFEEPECALVVAPSLPEGERVTLFLRERDPKMEVWVGQRLGVEAAPAALGVVDKAEPISALAEALPKLLKGAARVYHDLGAVDAHDAQVLKAMKAARRLRRDGSETPSAIVALDDLLDEQRLFKTEREIELLRRAARCNAAGHIRAMRAAMEGLREYHLQAVMQYEWSIRGARRVAFNTIIASASNACTLHYERNDCPLNAGDLVLVDAGCELDYYASDVTRTWPISGAFSEAQAAVYQCVLDAQKVGVDACVAGETFDGVHQKTARKLTEGMVAIGLLEGDVDTLLKEEGFKRYFLHKTSHWMGLDVHDVGRYYLEGDSRPLQPGMVLTIEPGIYVPVDDEEAPERFRGIGIRIEDDVLITADGPENLTAMIPKEIAELEALIGADPLALPEETLV